MKPLQTVKRNWQPLTIWFSAIFAVTFVYLFHIGIITHRLLSARESYIHQNYQSIRNIINNPVNAPYKLIDYLFLHLHAHSAAYARFTSVFFALIACTLFFVIVHRWHGKRTAVLSTSLFSTSAWMLHVGRIGTGDVLLVLIPLSLLLLASWANGTKRHGLALLYLTIISGLAFYTPGAIWFLALGFILIRKSIFNHIANAKLWEKLTCIAMISVLAGLLAFAIYRQPHILRDWLFLPTTIPTPLTLLKQLVESMTFLFIRGPYSPDLWLAHTPIVDVFTAAMTLLGGYFYLTHYRNLRTHVLIGFTIIGSILVALNGVLAMGYMVPIAYLLAATGLTYILHQWLTVFPRNPVARSFGIVVVTIAVMFTITYHLTNYFVAWRYSPETIQAFTYKP
jgi:hypothetical protein